MVVSPRYELKDAVAYLKPVDETPNTARSELFAITYDGVTLGRIAAGLYRIILRRMNADGKSYALARLKVEVIAG